MVWRSKRRIRSTTKPASATISSSFPNSDGWMLIHGSSIQLRDPFTTEPIGKTLRMKTSITP